MTIQPKTRSASERLRAELLRAIEAGELQPGDQLPSTRELGRRYDITHVTAALAVNQLVDDGYVIKRHGAGTFVAFRPGSRPGVVRLYTGGGLMSPQLQFGIDAWHRRCPSIRIEQVAQSASADFIVLSAAELDRPRQAIDLFPLDRLMDGKTDVDDTFHPFLMKKVRDSNHIYALPLWFSPEVILYNKTLVGQEAARIDYWTVDDLREAVARLHPELHPRGMRAYSHCSRFRYQTMPFVAAFGGTIVDDQCERCLLDDPATVRALYFARDVVRQMPGTIPGALSNVADLLAGKLALKSTSAMYYNKTLRKQPKQIRMAPFPNSLFPGGHVSGVWLALSAWTRAPEQAWDFMTFLTGPEFQNELARINCFFPGRREACTELLRRHQGRLDVIYRSALTAGVGPTGLSAQNLAFIDQQMHDWWHCDDLEALIAKTVDRVNARLCQVDIDALPDGWQDNVRHVCVKRPQCRDRP